MNEFSLSGATLKRTGKRTGGMKDFLAWGLLLLVLGGCSGKARRPDMGLTWPPPPETPRINFLGTITAE